MKFKILFLSFFVFNLFSCSEITFAVKVFNVTGHGLHNFNLNVVENLTVKELKNEISKIINIRDNEFLIEYKSYYLVLLNIKEKIRNYFNSISVDYNEVYVYLKNDKKDYYKKYKRNLDEC